MTLHYIFPTVIGQFDNPELRDHLLPHAKKVLNNKKLLTYQWGYKNTYGKSLKEIPEFNEFSEFLKVISSQYLNDLGYSCKKELKPEIFVSGMEDGDLHGIHSHPGAELSGVFYLDCPEGSSDIVFYDPRNFRDIKGYEIEKYNEITSGAFIIKPKNGMFLIWESWIRHEVLRNSSSSPRTTLVFNINFN
tara:strand:- start:581 stop:1150 length:570 start_codon:yes stop_codon:yes gene_type:complete